MAGYDEREEELSSIAAIFPELVTDDENAYAASIHLLVTPSTPLTVRFIAAPIPSPPNSDDGKMAYAAAVMATPDEHQLDHLPPLHLELSLPPGYPEDKAPEVTLTTDLEWLPANKLRQLEDEVKKLWDEFGHCQILFSYIDHLQQSAETSFGFLDTGLDLSPSLKPALLAYDAATKKSVFDAQTFDCGVCLEPKKGSECYRLKRCSHVFCRNCLQEAYNHFIAEGDVVHVCCLDPTCGKETLLSKKKRHRTLHPRELLDMDIPEHTVRRYVDMKRKKKLESDKTTVYCPRSWCQAPARSAKYPPLPVDLRQYPESDSDDNIGDGVNGSVPVVSDKSAKATADRLCVCSKCSLAFCRICYSTWHGDFARCWPRNPSELSEEEKASYDYIRQNTSPCPTCSSPVQKTMGCNHMTCFQCRTHFCYLCGAWLDGENPYIHFTNGSSSCYQRLWELEEGDEGQAGGFEGARRWEQEARRIAQEADEEEAQRLQNEELQRGVLMDAGADEDLPIRFNGPQLEQRQMMLPEAPAPPPQQIDAALAAQFARLQMQIPIPVQQRHGQQQPRRQVQNNPVERDRGRGRGAARQPAGGARGDRGRGRGAYNNPAPLPNQPRRRGGPQAAPPAEPWPRAEVPHAVDDEAAAAAFRRFVELAAQDQEEEWDSDELEDDDAWEIQPRVRQEGQAFVR